MACSVTVFSTEDSELITRHRGHHRFAASLACTAALLGIAPVAALAQPAGRDAYKNDTLELGAKKFIPPVMSMHRTQDEVDLGDGLKYVILRPGNATDIIDGTDIAFELNCFTAKGELLYSSRAPGNKPAGVKIPGTQMWPALEKAMMGMKRSEFRKILMPKELMPKGGMGPLPDDQDIVLEVGLFAVAPPVDPLIAHRNADGSTWMDLNIGEGDAFDRDGFATCHINVFNDLGELMGSTSITRVPLQVPGDANRYWVRYALGMKTGGTRIIEFDEPEAYRKMRLQQAGLNAVDVNKKHRWRLMVDCLIVTPPIKQTAHDPAKEVDIGDGIKIVDLVIGDGDVYPPPTPPGEKPIEYTPKINYSSWNADDGTLFDSSQKPGGGPIQYSPGLYPSVWQRGLAGMHKGGKRKMIVPANIDKGQDFKQIPDDRGFIYELELLDWEEALFQFTNDGGSLDFSEPVGDDSGTAADKVDPKK